MQEGAIMEVVKWFIGLLIMFSIIAVTVFAMNVSSVNNFKQQVNYEIERNGGLTEDAVDALNEYSKEYYPNESTENGGRFSVESDQLYETVPFGEPVDYTVVASVEVKFFPIIPDIEWGFKGTGVSYVR